MYGQISITGSGTANKYTQNFNTVSASLPSGWLFFETGSSANTSFSNGTGTGLTGDTYFFGNSSEWCFGGLQSNNLNPTIGVGFTNNTGKTITDIYISYKGETWRVGAASRSERLDFQYSVNATSLTTGTWTDFNALDYVNPGQATGSGSQQHSTTIVDSIKSLDIQNGSSFYIRWQDYNPSGADDGMGIDDFEIYVGTNCDNITPASSTMTTSVQCTESNWTYYGDASNKYFAIKKNGNTINATVDIDVNGTSQAPYVSTSSSGANQEHGSYLLGRYWNVTCTGCTYSSGGGVDVRFYYHASEPTNAQTERDNAHAALLISNGSTLAIKSSALEWFKTNSTTFAPSNFTGNILTVAHTKLSGSLGTQNGVNYVEFTGLSSFSGGTGGYSYGPPNTTTSANSLPVTWSKIDVLENSNNNTVIWQTASERNTSHFEVEASNDGKHFVKISSEIPAAGNSVNLLNYSFEDKDILPIKYYRIKQIDLESSYEYSKIVSLKRSDVENSDFQAMVYPKSIESNDYYTIVLKNKSVENSTIQIKDFLGKTVYHMNSNQPIESIDLSELSKGMYFLSVTNGANTSQIRLSK